MTLQITEYKSTTGEDMILIVDAENDKAESMTKATYEARLEAAKENGTIS
jgi:hypothetical protein